MSTPVKHFAPLARLLHWLMALMVIAMLFIGAGMVASVSQRHEWLLNLHKPLGIAILLLVIVRIIVRFNTRTPPLPADLPAVQALAAKLSHYVLYGLMLAMPLIGWAMISAAGDPVMLGSSVRLPSIVAANPETFALLRKAHEYLAYLFFLTILAHLAAALFHGWVRRDEVLDSMLRGKSGDSKR
jgi:cytochrome b561